MVKYNLIIEQSLQSTALKRVRIKVDPSLVSKVTDLAGCDGYEGYILAECGENYKVLIVAPGEAADMSVMEVPGNQLEDVDNDFDVIGAFIGFVLNKHRVSLDSSLGSQLSRASTIEQVESVLKQTGYTDDDVKILYRDFIASEEPTTVSEGVGTYLKLGAQAAAKAAVKGAAALPGKAVQAVGKGLNLAGTLLGGEHLGGALKGAGNTVSKVGSAISRAPGTAYNALKTQHKGLMDATAAENLKRITRPSGDPKTKDQIIITLPEGILPGITSPVVTSIDNVEAIPNGAVYTATIVQKPNDKANLAAYNALPFQQIKIANTGGTGSNITYYKNNPKSNKFEQVTVQGAAADLGLYYDQSKKVWFTNPTIQEIQNFDTFKPYLLNVLKSKKLDNQAIAAIQAATDYTDMKQVIKKVVPDINDSEYNNIVAKYFTDNKQKLHMAAPTPISKTDALLKTAMPSSRPQGGGKISGQLSNSPSAVKRRERNAAAKKQ